MEKKHISVQDSIPVNGLNLLPVFETSLNCRQGDSYISFKGIKQPVAVVIISPSVKKAFRISGEEVPFDQLIRELPSIRESLESI